MARAQIGALDAELIAVRCFAPARADRSWLVANDELPVAGSARKQSDEMLRRRAKGVPLAYLLGEKEFYGRRFLVNPAVLIPRPETETLIDLIKGLALGRRPRFLEVGTGSGCIAITLALEFPQAEVLATDLSTRALEVAEANDNLHEGRIELVQSNLLRDLALRRGERFDVLVANLPYVNKAWEWVEPDNLRFEPKMALYARAENGLSLYRRLLKEARQKLEVAYLVLEADPCQHLALQQMAREYGFWPVRAEGFGLVFSRRSDQG